MNNIKDLLMNDIDRITDILIDHLNQLKTKGKDKEFNKGLLYFSLRAPEYMSKIDNLDMIKDLVSGTEFIYTDEDYLDYFSTYGTYWNKRKLYYGGRLLKESEDMVLKILWNELVYSIMETTATASDTHMNRYKIDLPYMYYALGLIHTTKTIGRGKISELVRRKKLTEDLLVIEPNKESIKKRYKEDMEDRTVEYIILSKTKEFPFLEYRFKTRDNKKQHYYDLNYPIDSRFKYTL